MFLGGTAGKGIKRLTDRVYRPSLPIPAPRYLPQGHALVCDGTWLAPRRAVLGVGDSPQGGIVLPTYYGLPLYQEQKDQEDGHSGDEQEERPTP